MVPAEAGGRRLFMSDNYIIEIRPNAIGIAVQAGIVVRDGNRFRFYAATHAFNSLDGKLFKNPKAAEKAAVSRVADMTSRRPLVPPTGTADARRNAAS
jgi:hypothetical protein